MSDTYSSLDSFAEAKSAQLQAQSLLRHLATDMRGADGQLTRNGQPLISFSCNDYLGLTQHPRLKAAAVAATDVYGTGAGASRLVTGNHPLYQAYEEKLARFKGYAASLAFGSGYLANLGITPALMGADDVIFIDALAHNCLFAGAKLSGARVHVFDHNNVEHLSGLLSAHRPGHGRAMILTDGVFSMDGDLAPLNDLSRIAQTFDAWLMIDDAHGIGVLGQGRGTASLFPDADIPLNMGTCSKALGSYGGYLCASQPVITLLQSRARSLVYTTGLPPACLAASLEALTIIEAQPELTALPLAHAAAFCQALGLPPSASAVQPIIVGEAAVALAVQQSLITRGFLVAAIRPPTVPAGSARLRVAFSASHKRADVLALAAAIRELADLGHLNLEMSRK